MPSIHYLNPPPHPFWDFVANIEDHPFFAANGRPPTGTSRGPDDQAEQSQSEQQPAEKSEKSRGKQPTVENEHQDPPVVDPSTVKMNEDTNNEKTGKCGPGEENGMPWRGRGRFSAAFDENRRGRGCGPRGHHRGGRCGSPPEDGPDAGAGHHGPPRGPWWGFRGPPPPFGPFGPPRHRHHGPHGHSHGPRGERGESGNFNLAEFLSNLGNRLGIDLSGAAEGLGLERFNVLKTNPDADFEPRADVFDLQAQYVIHLSLPGAKKEDLGVDWDGENSVLRIAGVVHRPGADEELLKHLAVDGRKREVGVFEKSVKLGTKRDPASIDVAGIRAKMTDGVLVVKVPKVEVEHKKREVPISGSGSPSPVREVDMEKGTLLDTNNLYNATPQPERAPTTTAAEEKEAEQQREMDNRSETMDFEHEEKLPQYEDQEHEHDASDDEEGEYVKINVD